MPIRIPFRMHIQTDSCTGQLGSRPVQDLYGHKRLENRLASVSPEDRVNDKATSVLRLESTRTRKLENSMPDRRMTRPYYKLGSFVFDTLIDVLLRISLREFSIQRIAEADDMSEKWAVITGYLGPDRWAGRIASTFLDNGFKVILTRSVSTYDAKPLEDRGCKVLELDLASDASIDGVVKSINVITGGWLDVLVLNVRHFISPSTPHSD